MSGPEKLQRWVVGDGFDDDGNWYEYNYLHDDGKWVLYEDAKELEGKIARLTVERDKLMDDLSMSEFCKCGLRFVTNDAGGRICIECDVENCPKCGAAEFVEHNNVVDCRDCGYRETLSEEPK
jgi:ribosomal protein S27AE